jgi:hypothetical protein
MEDAADAQEDLEALVNGQLGDELAHCKYLSADEKTKILDSRPGAEDIDEEGSVNRERLTAAMTILVKKNDEFSCKPHLKEYVASIGHFWGFHVIWQSFGLFCGRGRQRQKKESTVSPSRQRNRENNVKIGCPFCCQMRSG